MEESRKDPTPDAAPVAASLSRRELLRRAGWAVPAIVALPLLPGTAHAHRHASPGTKSPSKSWSKGSDDKDWDKKDKKDKKGKKDEKGKKEDAGKALRDLLGKLFGGRR